MKIRYDNETKIWKSLDYKHGDFVRHFIGQVFLENVGKVQADKVIEWHYDTSQGRTMEEIYREAITVAMNLQKMGVKKADVVVFYCMMNSKVSSLAMGALMLGATVNFYETNFPEESAKYTLNLLNPTVILYEERFKSFLFKILKDIHLPRLQHKLTIDGLEANCIDKQLLKSISSFALDSFRLPKLGEPDKLAAFLLFTGPRAYPKAVPLVMPRYYMAC
ncbi:hypothetical protein DOY81_014666 [Sarcophaga bullata]|nr:hypothetical protein DOY81_014666 [Sarcophaga bullata]